MKSYIGTKRIKAKPMNRQDYNDYRGRGLPADENGADEGYLVEYLDGGKPNHPNHGGYISWSPKDVFKGAYKGSGNLTFSHALELVKSGYKLQRKGWHGKGIFIFLTPENGEVCSFLTINTVGLQSDNPHAKKAVVPWIPSHTDVLADDWLIVE